MFNSTVTASVLVDTVLDKHEVANLAQTPYVIKNDTPLYKVAVIPTSVNELITASESLDDSLIFLSQAHAQEFINKMNQQIEEFALNQPVKVTFTYGTGIVSKSTYTYAEFLEEMGSSTLRAFSPSSDTFMTSKGMLFTIDQRVGKTTFLRRISKYVKASPQVSKFFESVYGKDQ